MQRTFVQSLRFLNHYHTFDPSMRVSRPDLASRLWTLSLASGGGVCTVRNKSTKAAKQKTTSSPSTSAFPAASTISADSQTTVSKAFEETLSWPEYFNIRRSKRRWQNLAAVPCSVLGLIAGASYFGSLDTDPMKPILGLDPFMFYGICTTACMGVGYVVGPTFGAFLWRLLPSSKRYGSLIDKKDKEFYERIAKNRVDVTLQSPTSPVPDYYGEKIGSLHGYRKWLRDQNKYRRKIMFDEAT